MRRLILGLILTASLSQAQAATPPTPAPVSVYGGSGSLAISSVSANAAVPAAVATFPVIEAICDAPVECFVAIGTSSVTATTSSLPIQAGRSRAFWLTNAAGYIAGITSAGSGTLRFIQWTGAPNYGGAPDAIALTPASTSAAAASLVLKASAGTFYGGSVTSTVAGYAMLFNLASLPANGSVSPVKCATVPANQTVSFSSDPGTAWTFSTGITLGFSTTGCYTLTASATAFFTGQAQ